MPLIVVRYKNKNDPKRNFFKTSGHGNLQKLFYYFFFDNYTYNISRFNLSIMKLNIYETIQKINTN